MPVVLSLSRARVTPMRCLLVASLLVAAFAAAAQPVPAARAAAAESLRFDILEFVVDGNSVLPTETIERAVYPFLGPGKTVADAEGARKALEQAYQRAGYLSVQVELPPQRIREGGGELRLRVTEAPIVQMQVTGARYHLPSRVADAVPSLAVGSVPNFNEMQEELGAVARESADREVTPIVSAGERPGTMNAEIKVQDKAPLHGFVELNSKQSQFTERGRLEASASYDNLFQRRHSIGAYWFYSPRRPNQANIWSLNYGLPLGGRGDTLVFGATHSDSETPTPLGGGTVSKGDTYTLRWRNELRSRGSYFHALSFGATHRSLDDANRDVAGATVPATPLSYPSFQLNYDFTQPGDGGRLTTLGAGLNVGVPLWGRRQVDCNGRALEQFECKRTGASAAFQVLNLGASHREPVFGAWSVFVRGQLQLASGPLVPAEQVTYGGADSVRGYYEGEQAGDQGWSLRGEFTTPAVNAGGLRWQALAFGDRAQVRKIEPLPVELAKVNLGSWGLGLRADSAWGLQLRLDWAHVVFDTLKLDSQGVLQPTTGAAAGRDQRWEISVRQSF